MFYSRGRSARPLVAMIFVAAAGGSLWLAQQFEAGLAAQREWGTVAARFIEAGFEITPVQTQPGITEEQRVPVVRYAYEISGRRYVGRTVALPWLRYLGCAAFEEQALRTAAEHVETTARFDPRCPGDSLLTLAFDRWLIVGWLLLGIGIAGASGRSFLRALQLLRGATAAPRRVELPHAAAAVSGLGLLLMAVRYGSAGEASVRSWVVGLLATLFGVWPLLRPFVPRARQLWARCVRVTRAPRRRAA